MGRGNYLPINSSWVDYEMVYAQTSLDLDNFAPIVRRLLSDSFYPCSETDWASGDKAELIVAESNLLEVRLADNEWSTAVIVRVKDSAYDHNEHGLACRHLPFAARRLFNGLHAKGIELRVRAGAYYSNEYLPTSKQRVTV